MQQGVNSLARVGAVLNWAVHTLAHPNIVSFTVRDNLPSRRVMEKIGLTHNSADDFDHPLLAADNPLRPHVLYRYASSR
jgi:RimJ/RimL family protein N-acetyltransferase